MTASELRYLLAIDELYKDNSAVKQSDLAIKLGVSKVSAFNAMERLCEKGFVEKSEKKLALTERGQDLLVDYKAIIEFIAEHLAFHCGTVMERAYNDALNATCALSDETRDGIAGFLEKRRGYESRV